MFPFIILSEEVENAIKNYQGVQDVVVLGTPSERWGSQVTALVQMQEGVEFDQKEIKALVKQYIADYKVPKLIFPVKKVNRYDNGKLDYKKIKVLAESLV